MTPENIINTDGINTMMEDIKKEIGETVNEVYKDVAQPTVKVIGTSLERTTKLLLAPINGFLWSGEQIVDWVAEKVNPEVEKIPEEFRQAPTPEIAVPLLQSMYYSGGIDELRAMYSKLLIKSMDSRENKNVHPSYVEIIKQMNSLDATLFKLIYSTGKNLAVIQPEVGYGTKTQGQVYVDVMPNWYVGIHVTDYDMFDISTSLIRLNRLGLITLSTMSWMRDTTIYDALANSVELVNIQKQCEKVNADNNTEIKHANGILMVNDFGQRFARVCI